MPTQISQKQPRIVPISCLDTFVFQKYIRETDENHVSIIVNFIEKNRLTPYLFGECIINPNYESVEIVGALKEDNLSDLIRVDSRLSLGLENTIAISGELFDVEIDNKNNYNYRFSKGRVYLITPIQNSFGRLFRKKAPLELSIVSEEDLKKFDSSGYYDEPFELSRFH